MSAKWFKVETDFVDHPKVDSLARRLGNDQAGWYVMRLWSWVSRFCPTGHVPGHLKLSLEASMNWTGEPGFLVVSMVESGLIDVDEDGNLDVHDWADYQKQVSESAIESRDRKREYRAKLKALNVPLLSHGTDMGHVPTGRDVTGRDVTYLKEGQTQAFDLVTQGVKEKPSRKPPDPEAELVRFLADLSEGEREIFRTYEAASGVTLGPDRTLLKLVRQKMKAHPVDELCAAIKGHCADPWNREKKRFSLRAIFSDASVIASNALKGRGL